MKKLIISGLLFIVISSCKPTFNKSQVLEENNRLLKENNNLKDSINKLTSYKLNDSIVPVIEFVDLPQVLYRGIKNRINISVPYADSLTVTLDSTIIKKTSNRHYAIDVTGKRRRNTSLNIKAYFGDSLTKNFVRDYKIVTIGKPEGRINGKGSNIKMTKKDLKGAKITVSLGEFVYNLNFNVISYKIQLKNFSQDLFKGNSIHNIEGNTIGEEIYEKINKLEKGDLITIFDISVRNSTSSFLMKSPSPIIIEIIDEIN